MKIFVTRNIPSLGLEKLRSVNHEVIVSSKDVVLTRAELIERLKLENPDAVLCLLTDKIDGEIFDAAPNAKIFANYAVGFDNIDLQAAKERGVTITNTPDVLTEAVAEYTVALILAIGRKVVQADRFLEDGKYQGWDPLLLLGTEFKGKTLGIVGGGRIGSRVAEIMRQGFGMNIIYHDRQKNESLEKSLSAVFYSALDEMLALADVISIHLPLNDDTHHLFSSKSLALMKHTALLINTARGAIVDETALVDALKSGVIAGAALDVFENEPRLDPSLSALDNLIVTPHIASATIEARDEMSRVAAENILAVLQGKAPLNQVL